MAFSFSQETGDGVTSSFTFSFVGQDDGYIRESDIVVEVDGVDTPFTLTSSNTLELSSPPANGADILIRRVMPKDAPYADFRRGNNFGQEVLNSSFLQSLYIIHEALDGFFPDGFEFLTDVGFSGDVTFNGFDISDVGTLTADDIVIGPNSLSADAILTEAYNWAQYPEDQLVPEGNGTTEYSAYHYSLKSEEQADNSAQSAADSLATLKDFKDRYWGEYASDPAASPGNGLPPATGNLYWNTTEGRLKVFNGVSWGYFDITGAVLYTALDGAAELPYGPTSARPVSPNFGYTRGNTDTGKLEWWNGSTWSPVGAGATGGGGDQVFVENDQVITADYTLASNKNAYTTGPVTVLDDVTVTISDGARWVVG